MPESTLSELFAKDPYEYTKQDLDRIVAEYREKRKMFNLGDKQAAKPGRTSLSDVLKDAGLLG